MLETVDQLHLYHVYIILIVFGTCEFWLRPVWCILKVKMYMDEYV